MRLDRKTKNDGYTNFLGGIDSGKAPNLLAENQLAFAVNCTMRGGHVETRPGFKQISLTFEDEEISEWWDDADNRIQGAGFYNDDIICSIAGRIFFVNTADWSVKDISPKKIALVMIPTTVPATPVPISPPMNGSVVVYVDTFVTPNIGEPVWINSGKYKVVSFSGNQFTLQNIGAVPGVSIPAGTVVSFADLNSGILPHAWMLQVEQYFIIQDGSSKPLIYDGSTRRAIPTNHEVPVGTVMAYGMGRLWIATSDRMFVAGDINNGPSSVLQFTENDYLNEGGAFSVPGNAGKITGMTFLSNLDTSMGQGPLMVFTENAIFSVNAPVDRTAWKDLTYPIQTVSLTSYGGTGQFSIQLVNGDVFYRAIDGLRSFVLARRDFGSWGNLPISREITRVMSDDQNMLHFTNSALFNNRYMFNVGIHKDKTGAYSDALAVLDFDLLSSMGQKSPPVWEGVWTGLRFTRIVTGVINGMHRCFSFSVDADGVNQLWEITTEDRFDNDMCKITSSIETRSMMHGSPFEATELTTTEFWVDDLAGEVDFVVKYRPDQYPCWFDWTNWIEEQTARDCSVGTEDNCWTPTEYKPGYRTRMTLPKPPLTCEESDGKPSNMGYEFQLKMQWSGHARLKRMLVKTTEIEEGVAGNLVC